MQHHTAATLLTEIRNLWPELDNVPTGRRHDLPRPQTPEQRDRARQRWHAERADQLAGHTGRGASPAPGNLDQLAAKIDADAELCALADRVAAHVQPSAAPATVERYWHVYLTKGHPCRWRLRLTPTDPGRWDYTHRHGAPWAITWLLGALTDGVPATVADDITAVARHVHRMLSTALDGQRERYAGRCNTCRAPLAITTWDTVINCTGCGSTYGRSSWLDIAGQKGA